MFARPSSPCGHSLFFPKFILRSALSEHGVCISKIISDNTSYEQEGGMESKRGQELRNERVKEKSVRGRERRRGKKGTIIFMCIAREDMVEQAHYFLFVQATVLGVWRGTGFSSVV